MTEKECYAVLEISKKSDLETVKKAYRRLAFAFHPDLNPSLPDAARRFQMINEAYVTLVDIHAEKVQKQSGSDWKASDGASGRQSEEGTERARRDAEKAYSKAKSDQDDDKTSANANKPGDGAAYGSSATDGSASSEHGAQGQGQKNEEKERVINDILNDPFAKRVFEDIYKRIQDVAHEKILRPAAEVVVPGKGRTRKTSGAASFLDKVRNWALRQIDDEQVLRLPGNQILPGARIRMQIQHGITSEVQTIEVTLPVEFAPGKTMRLKGLGKRVGSLSGDLYVRIEPI